METLFCYLLDSCTGPTKLVSIVADNFSFSEDKARFLKATLGIPFVKDSLMRDSPKVLIQFGPIQQDIESVLKARGFNILKFDDLTRNISKDVEEALNPENIDPKKQRPIVFINDMSRLELQNNTESQRFLVMMEKIKNLGHPKRPHLFALLYQNSPNSRSKLLRNMLYLSDATVEAKTGNTFDYFLKINHQTVFQRNTNLKKTLMPLKFENRYCTCKIGQNYWYSDLLCFFEIQYLQEGVNPEEYLKKLEQGQYKKLEDCNPELISSDGDNEDERESTLPYTLASDPERSRIFYYPDKDDDIDEDDPDNDLNF